jgi:hypothetical protein
MPNVTDGKKLIECEMRAMSPSGDKTYPRIRGGENLMEAEFNEDYRVERRAIDKANLEVRFKEITVR